MIKRDKNNLYITPDEKVFESLRDACIHQARTIVDNDADPVEFFTNNRAVLERVKKLANQLEKEFLEVNKNVKSS